MRLHLPDLRRRSRSPSPRGCLQRRSVVDPPRPQGVARLVGAEAACELRVRQYVAVAGMHEEDRRPVARLLQGHGARLAAADIGRDLPSHRGRRRGADDGDQREVALAGQVPDSSDRLGAEDRVAAEREEVVADADARTGRAPTPRSRSAAVSRNPYGGGQRARSCLVHGNPEPLGEPDPLELAGRALRDLVDDEDAARAP